MATVPVQTSPSVALSAQGPGNVQAGPEVRPFENFTPKQIAEAGNAQMKLNSTIATIKEKLQDEYNDARTKELFNQYTREVDKVQTSFLAQTGNIAQSYDQSLASIQEIQTKFSSAADNQTIKMGFSQKADALTTSVAGTLTRHSLAQSREYANNEAKSEIGTFVQQASTHWTEAQLPVLPGTPPNEYQKFAGAAIAAVNKYSDKQNWAVDSYQRQQMLLEVNSSLNVGVVVNMATAGQNAAADAYLEKAFKAGTINAEKYTQLKNGLKEGITRDNANAYADAVYGAFTVQGKAQGNQTVVVNGKTVANPMTGVTFESNIAQLILLEGGGKYVANDGGKGPTKWGINGKANGLTETEVMNLTREQAIEIYKREYWDKPGIENLPPNIRATAFDAAVNQGPLAMQQMLKKAKSSDGSNTYDVAYFNQLRRGKYQDTLNNGEFYKNLPAEEKAKYKASWDGRVAVSGTGGTTVNLALDADTGLPNLASMISHIRNTVTDVNERNAAIAIVSQRHAQDESAWTQNYQNVVKRSSDIALSAPGAWTKVPPADWAQLRPADKIALQNGPERGTNSDTQIFLMRNPQEWAPGKIEKYRKDLSENVYMSFIAKYEAEIKSSGKIDDKVIEVGIDKTNFERILLDTKGRKVPGFDVDDLSKLASPKSDAEKKARIYLEDKVETLINLEQQRQKRKLNRQEKSEIINSVLLDTVAVKDWGFSDTAYSMFQLEANPELMKDAYVVVPGGNKDNKDRIFLKSIPADVRGMIVEAYKNDPANRGRNPTQLEIAQTWVRFGKPRDAAEAQNRGRR
jgi:hypothetical protein